MWVTCGGGWSVENSSQLTHRHRDVGDVLVPANLEDAAERRPREETELRVAMNIDGEHRILVAFLGVVVEARLDLLGETLAGMRITKQQQGTENPSTTH